MRYVIKFYSIPSRTLPMHFTNSNGATIIRRSHIVNTIRSPHIDKRSWEQFQFFLKKQIIVCKGRTSIKQFLSAKQTLKQMFAVLRIKIIAKENYRFKTTF